MEPDAPEFEGCAELINDLPIEDQVEIYARARRNARLRISIYVHGMVFVVGMLILIVINLSASPNTLWFVWPFGGWGLGLLIHWFTATRLVQIYDGIKEREIARQLDLHRIR